MAFNTLSKGVFQARPPVVDRVAMNNPGTGTISIMLSRDLIDSLGDPTFLRVGVGTGDHAGMILLKGTANATGAYKLGSNGTKGSKENGQKKISLTPNKLGLSRDKMPITVLKHKMTDDGLVIWLPKA